MADEGVEPFQAWMKARSESTEVAANGIPRHLHKVALSQLPRLENVLQSHKKLSIWVKLTIVQQICDILARLAARGIHHSRLRLNSVVVYSFDPEAPSRIDLDLVPLSSTEQNESRGEAYTVVQFGLLGWKVFAHGSDSSYGRLSEEDAKALVARGEELPCTPGCPQLIYAVLYECFRREANSRSRTVGQDLLCHFDHPVHVTSE